MGIPYSRQIHAAFDEVTPLVASGFDVLRTIRNISVLLAAVQLLTLALLCLTLLTLAALLVSVSPDLEDERRALVTPAVKWLAWWAMDRRWLWVAAWTVIVGGAVGAYAGVRLTRDVDLRASEGVEAGQGCEGEGQDGEEGDGEGKAEK